MDGVQEGRSLNVTSKMIAIILAGGYAKRLWPLTLDKPKALLLVAGKPIINYTVEKLISLEPPLSEIILSTNLKFLLQFEEWLQNSQYHNIRIIPEESRREREKLGAVRALAEIVDRIRDEETLVLAGDNLFTDRLQGLVRFFHEKQAPTVALYHAKNLAETRKGSSVTINESNMILNFVEKPSNPRSTLVGACIYVFPTGIMRRLREYLTLGQRTDEPGRFIEWLYLQEPVYGYLLKDYLWDIGTIDSYKAADEDFARSKAQSRERN
jgi:glucose-1-phosphate thymidylyltransferase